MSGQQDDLKNTSAVVLDDVNVAPSALLGSLLIFFFSVPFVVFGNGFLVMVGAVMIVLSFIDAANIATLMLTTKCLVNNGNLVIKYGLSRRLNISIPAPAIRDIKIKQTWFGSIFKYGSIIIVGDDLGVMLQYIKNPLAAMEAIKKSIGIGP
ncbi:MAG: PH domain-containing protein [Acidithiobacillus ferrivorans]